MKTFLRALAGLLGSLMLGYVLVWVVGRVWSIHLIGTAALGIVFVRFAVSGRSGKNQYDRKV
jgi:hypothetical protein